MPESNTKYCGEKYGGQGIESAREGVCVCVCVCVLEGGEVPVVFDGVVREGFLLW